MGDDLFAQYAVLGAFMPQRLHMRLGVPVDAYAEGNRLAITGDALAMSTVAHEHAHWFQTLFTGYGQIAWDAHRQATSYLMTEWNALSKLAGGKRRLPLAHLARTDPRALGPATFAHRTTEEQLRQGQARYSVGNPGATLDVLGVRLVPGYLANPTIEVAGAPHVLQTVEVVEGHAVAVEVTYVAREFGLSLQEAWDRENRSRRYLVAFDWFVERCGLERQGDFPFVCDLALQTSCDPVVPRTEADWRAANPAFRFVSLVEALRERPSVTLGDGSDLHARYDGFASELLSAARCRPLPTVLAERIAAHTRKPVRLELEQLMLSGLHLRSAKPWCGGNPALDPVLWAELLEKFPAPLVQIEGRLTSLGGGRLALSKELVMELQFQALASQVFGDFSQAAKDERALECAFSKYRIDAGCEYQTSHGCTGRYRPDVGPPVPLTIGADDTVTGCSFEMLLRTSGTAGSEIDLDPAARMPTDDELRSIASERRRT